MDLSPFPYQGPLTAEQVQGREDLVADLIERVTARRVTALLGPRRFGKTSVLRKVEGVLTEAGTSVVWLDLYACASFTDLSVRIDTALAKSVGDVRRRLDSIAASAALNLGVLRVEFSRPPAKRPDPESSLHLLLDVLVEAAVATPTALIIDEFSGLANVDDAAGILRTKLQHHVQDVGLLFAGSEPSVMTAMFSDRAQPFYAQADLVEIAPLSRSDLDMIIANGFAATERDPAGLASNIYSLTSGHPYRAMQLADAAWQLTEPGVIPPSDRWAKTLEAVQRSTHTGLETIFDSFSAPEKAVLRARASERPIFGASLELYGVSSGSMTAARDRLIDDGTLTKDMALVDPLLGDWIRRSFPL